MNEKGGKKLKTVFFVLLSALFLFANSIFSVKIDKINPTDSEYPSGRGPNQLVVYTPQFGDSTGTNKYGLEAVVRKGIVNKVGGNNSPIPADGFVISGHGKGASWISQNLFPGVRVKIKENQLICEVGPDAYLYWTEYFLNRALSNLEKFAQQKSTGFDPDRLANAISALQKNVQQLKNQPRPDSLKIMSALQESKRLFYQSYPSKKGELRAVWYHIRAKKPEELEQAVKQMKELGVNVICPETIYGGYAIYPNAHPDLPQNPQFIGWDPLAELVRLSQKYEMKLIPWVWVFFVGRENSPLVNSKADWLAVNYSGQHASEMEKGYHFFCPARDHVHNFWLQVYRTMLSRYQLDGLQLDYIRYPVSMPYDKGFCYCEHCRKQFTLDYLVDPLAIDPENDAQIWKKWQLFREKQVTRFVAKVHRLISSEFTQVKLSADVFPDIKESRQLKMQNWGYWLKKGYLQEIFTMSYTPDVQTVQQEACYLKTVLPQDVQGYVGLGPYQKFSAEILLDEIQQVRQAGHSGVCLFEFGSLTEEQKEALKLGPFRIQQE